MKKIILFFMVLLIPVMGLAGCSYYDDTYKGTTYYSLVPATVPEKTATLDQDGKTVDGEFSYIYSINWVDKDGNEMTRKVEISGKNPEALTPGKYISAEISKKRITKGPNYIEKGEIPQNALAKIQ
jgi:uncharacterized protein YxeA